MIDSESEQYLEREEDFVLCRLVQVRRIDGEGCQSHCYGYREMLMSSSVWLTSTTILLR